MQLHAGLISIAVLACALSPKNALAQQYTAIDLGTFGGTTSQAYGINASGEVVGNASTIGNGYPNAAFVTDPTNHAIKNIGTLGGAWAEARAINANGQITGSSATATGSRRAYVTDAISGTMKNLGTLWGDTTIESLMGSLGLGINGQGQITGWSDGPRNSLRFMTVITTDLLTGGIRELGTLGGEYAAGVSISDSGRIAGGSYTFGNAELHAFVSDPNTSTLTDIGTLGGTESTAQSINNKDHVTGYSRTVGDLETRAFIASPPLYAMKDIGSLGGSYSSGEGINSPGQIVGSSTTVENKFHGFLYSGGKMMDLNSLLSLEQQSIYEIRVGNAINDRGQIAATGYIRSTGQERAFLLNPKTYYPSLRPTLIGSKGAGGWYVGPVSISWLVTGLPAPRTSGCGASQVTADTKGRVFTCAATNSAGNATQSVTVKVDQGLPQAAITSPQASAVRTYSKNQVVFARYICSDLVSGVVSCVGSVANGARVYTSTPGTYSFVVTATDRAGNTSSKTVAYRVL